MPLIFNNFTSDFDLDRPIFNNFTSDFELSKVLFNNNVSDHIIWTSEQVFFNNGAIVPWSTYAYAGDEVSATSILYGKGNNTISLVSIWTTDKIDFSKLKKISFHFTQAETYNDGVILCGVTDKTGSDINNFTSPYIVSQNGGVGVIEIDVASINGLHHLAVSLANSTGLGTSFAINKVVGT